MNRRTFLFAAGAAAAGAVLPAPTFPVRASIHVVFNPANGLYSAEWDASAIFLAS